MFEKLKDPHTQEMAKMLLRQLLQFAGGALVTMGFLKAGTYSAILEHSESLMGAGITIGTVAWMIIRNTKSAIVANVDQYPEVKGVITNPTPEGKALAASVPSPTVAVAATTGSKKK